MQIETIRKRLNFKKNDIYNVLSRKKYERIIQYPESMNLEELYILGNLFGVSHLELLEMLGYASYDFPLVIENNVDRYIETCVGYINEKKFDKIADEIDYLEDNKLVFKNVKYLNTWVFLKKYISDETPDDNFKSYNLTREQLMDIILYYRKRNENDTTLLLSQDLQLLTNLLSSEIWFVDLIFELSDLIINLELIETDSKLYELFQYIVFNALYFSYIEGNYIVSSYFTNLYNLLNPRLRNKNQRYDLYIGIALIGYLVSYTQTNIKEYYSLALEQQEILSAFPQNDIMDFCDEVLDAVIKKENGSLKSRESYFIYKSKLHTDYD